MNKKVIKDFFLGLLILLILGVSIIVYMFCFKSPSIKKSETKEKKVQKEEYQASLVMVGDALIHSNIYLDAKKSDGTYDFKPMLELTKPITT